jgi:hypothetical protein
MAGDLLVLVDIGQLGGLGLLTDHRDSLRESLSNSLRFLLPGLYSG